MTVADVPGLRPTPERVRETLFNWLMPRLPGARCLDLFAGTGALGIEALSRGAASVVFVDESAIAVETLGRNIATLGAEGATVRHGDALGLLAEPGLGPFDIVFLDPPFAADRIGEVCRLLDESSLLADAARVYVEEDRARPRARFPDGWQLSRSQIAGNVRYSLLTTRA